MARLLALNSTGRVIKENSTTSENSRMPICTSGCQEKIRPMINSGMARLEPMLMTGTAALRSIRGA